MNEQILLWTREFLQRVKLEAPEIPAFLQVMEAINNQLKPNEGFTEVKSDE